LCSATTYIPACCDCSRSPSSRINTFVTQPNTWPRLLGEQLCQQGYNVLAARLPYHGLKDPLTTEQSKMTAEDMAALTQETVDIAQGLGDKVTIAGLSAGGVMAAWAAQLGP
jgi:esterase/lipase